MHTTDEVLRVLRFYQRQNLTLDEVIQIIEYDRDDAIPGTLSNQPESVSGSQRVPAAS